MWLKAWHRKQRALRKSLEGSHAHRLWGDQLFSKVLWSTDRRSIAGGLSLGLFVAFTPTIPFQMLIVTFAALYLRVNLPIGLAACWVTNPLTAIPVYLAALKVGTYIVAHFDPIDEVLDLHGMEGRSTGLLRQAMCIWIGSLVFASSAALAAQVLVRVFWETVYRITHPRGRQLELKPDSPHEEGSAEDPAHHEGR